MTTLTKQLAAPKSKNLIFTSAGENTNLHQWLKGQTDFDLWISYYGDHDGKYSDVADYYMMRKGAKFPGLHYVYSQWPEIIAQYDSVFVMDDDLIYSGSDISTLFSILKEESLWLLQPAFDRRGKVSFSINQVQAFSYLRYTNFVEVACPMFKRDMLDRFMKVYDPTVIGWGVDIWFSQLFSEQNTNNDKIAIIDAISCINPREVKKIASVREIDKLQSKETRQQIWQDIASKNAIDPNPPRIQYAQRKAGLSFQSIVRGIKIWSIDMAFSCYKWLKNDTWRPS